MNLRFLVKPPGCLLAPLWIALVLPVLMVLFSLKVIACVLRDADLIPSDRKKARSSHDRREKSKGNKVQAFGDLHLKHREPPERKSKRHAQRLLSELNEALDYNQRIPPEKKSSLKQQVGQMTDYAVASLEKLARIRGRKAIVSSKRQTELEQLEGRLSVEINRSLDMLEDALVSIITVDVIGGNARIDRLLTDLHESNARLRDTADAHNEIRTVREAWVGELE
jgi:hypothetical protein